MVNIMPSEIGTHHWYELGLQLGLEANNLLASSNSLVHGDTDVWRRNMFSLWQKSATHPLDQMDSIIYYYY